MLEPTIYYVRHGQTDWNAEFRFQGSKDIPLNHLGKAQADANGRKLASILGQGEGCRFISSPLGRARETMRRIRIGMGLDAEGYEIDHLLVERNYGVLEGVSLSELKQANRTMHRERKADRWGFTPENGESHEEVVERIVKWYHSLTGDCVVAGHGAVGRTLRFYLLDLEAQDAGDFVFPQDKICIIRKGSERFV